MLIGECSVRTFNTYLANEEREQQQRLRWRRRQQKRWLHKELPIVSIGLTFFLWFIQQFALILLPSVILYLTLNVLFLLVLMCCDKIHICLEVDEYGLMTGTATHHHFTHATISLSLSSSYTIFLNGHLLNRVQCMWKRASIHRFSVFQRPSQFNNYKLWL